MGGLIVQDNAHDQNKLMWNVLRAEVEYATGIYVPLLQALSGQRKIME